jgi:hypothetical protein
MPYASREDLLARQLRYRTKKREEVLTYYSPTSPPSCACCGATANLGIDHIKGDGARHRQELSGNPRDGSGIHTWLIRNGFPPGYQVLCRSCNSSKSDGDRCRIDHRTKIVIEVGTICEAALSEDITTRRAPRYYP